MERLMDAKARAAASIVQARIELDRALLAMDSIRPLDPTLIGAVAHALSNYISVTAATVEMLQLTLKDYQDGEVPTWLDGIQHAADLMQHSVGRLVSASTPRDFPLKLEHVDLRILMERACHYYRRRADPRDVTIAYRTIGRVPMVWGDRVAIAVIADNLLANAVQASPTHSTIDVQLMAEPGYAVCTVRDVGPGFTGEEEAALLQKPLEGGAGSSDTRGLGIAIAREFTRRMDGDLWSESEAGTGGRFSFKLPAIE
jgi:signal transduction histidine kinase